MQPPTKKSPALATRLAAALALCAAAALVNPAAAQQTMLLAGSGQGLSNPHQTMFQSHNQKVVENANGIFCTLPGILLDRSIDGGHTFTEVYNSGYTNTLKAPTIESDENNNIYLIYPDPSGTSTRFQKFTSANGYTSPTIDKTFSQATSDSKFASFYDQGRGYIYHATQHGYLFTFDTSGNFIRGQQLFNTGSTGSGASYPHLFVDTSGVIHYALTTADANAYIPYETIRYLKSANGGTNWTTMSGTAITIPTTCNSNGPSTMINLAGEEVYNTWLANMHVKNGKVHFMYKVRNPANPAGVGNPPTITNYMHYMRFDATTGVREIDSRSNFAGGVWKGETLTVISVSGSFASDPSKPNGPLFAMFENGDSNPRTIAALVSYDNGSTWHDWAISPDVSLVGDVGDARFSPAYGHVIGTFSGAPGGIWATPQFYQFAVAPSTNYWDCNGSTAGFGTAGDFWGASADWSANSAGTATPGTYTTTTLDTLYFGTGSSGLGSGTVTVTNSSQGFGALIFGAASGAITIGGNASLVMASPAIITVNNASNTISVPMTSGALVKSGSGTLTLSGASTYTGATAVNDGALTLGVGGSISASSPISIASGKFLYLSGSAFNQLGAANPGGAVTIAGTLRATTAQAQTMNRAITLNGGTMDSTGGAPSDYGAYFFGSSQTVTANGTGNTISGNGKVGITSSTTLTLSTPLSGDTLTVSAALGTGTANGNSGALTKTGLGTVTLSGPNTYTGATTVNQGTLTIGPGGSVNSASLLSIASGAVVNLSQSAWNAFGASQQSGTWTIAGTLRATTAQANTVVAHISLTNGMMESTGGAPTDYGAFYLAGKTVTANGASNTISGNGGVGITGTVTLDTPLATDALSISAAVGATSAMWGGLTKKGVGIVTLSGVNTYTGATTVSNGTLLVNGSLGNTSVAVAGGTLGGTGIIGGVVNVQSGGTLSPGASIGTLSISNSLTLGGTTFVEVNASNGQNDRVQGMSSLTYGGSLVVSNVAGTLTAGQSFQLFSVPGTFSGNFTSITPALTGGKAWSFNPTNGVLSVVSPTATYPTNISFSFSGGTLSLTWPATHLGWFAQSNNVSVASSSNWFDVPGSSGVTNLNVIPSPAQPNVFYRLRSP